MAPPSISVRRNKVPRFKTCDQDEPASTVSSHKTTDSLITCLPSSVRIFLKPLHAAHARRHRKRRTFHTRRGGKAHRRICAVLTTTVRNVLRKERGWGTAAHIHRGKAQKYLNRDVGPDMTWRVRHRHACSIAMKRGEREKNLFMGPIIC